MTEHVYSPFEQSLAAGNLNEAVVTHELQYHGIPVVLPPPGKQPHDFFLPNGAPCEVKLDIRSQSTSNSAIEYPTLARGAHFYFHTLTYCRVYTHEEYTQLYNHGKKIEGMGELDYDGRYIPVKVMGQYGVPLWMFIKNLKRQS